MARKAKSQLVTEQLREYIVDSGLSGNALATEAGIPRQIVNYFLAGKRGLSGESIDRLCSALRLKLVQTGSKRRS